MAFLAAAVVGLFEDVIGRVTALAVLLPIVSGQGGNSGAQALAVVIRGLALREILPGSAWRIVCKEVIAGFLNGLAIAGLAGAAIPLVLKKLGRDPAQSSSIFLTTVTDVVGFAAFLGFAMLFIGWITP